MAEGGKKSKEEKKKGYKWEFKDSNKDFWTQGHGATKSLSLVNWIGIADMSVGGGGVVPQKQGEHLQHLRCMYFFHPDLNKHCTDLFPKSGHAPLPDPAPHYGIVNLRFLLLPLLLCGPQIHSLHLLAYDGK